MITPGRPGTCQSACSSMSPLFVPAVVKQILTIISASSCVTNCLRVSFLSLPCTWLCDLCPTVSKESMLLHPLLYGVGNSTCQAVAVCWENNTQALFLHLWYVLLGNPPTNSRGCWVALSHTVAMELNRHIAISFLVFSLRHFPADDNYRVQLFTAISMWLCLYLFVSFISPMRISYLLFSNLAQILS